LPELPFSTVVVASAQVGSGAQNWLIVARLCLLRRRSVKRVIDLKLFEPTAVHFLVAGRDGWRAAMQICQLLQRRRSL